MTKTEQWAQHVAAQAKSGKGIAQYCREQAISEKSFGYYRRKLSSSVHLGRPRSESFVQLSGKEEHFEISFGEEVAVKIPVSYGLARVMEALGVSSE